MYYVYILQSDKDGSYYVGSTGELARRLLQHNNGWSKATKSKRPWKLVYTESFEFKRDALIRERKIKAMKSRVYIETLVLGSPPLAVPD